VPDEVKKIFGILSNVADGVSSFKPPKKIKKGSGRKGDDGNPKDRSKPRSGTGTGNSGNGSGSGGGKKKCNIPPGKATQRLNPAKNTLRVRTCVRDATETTELILTSIVYAAAATATQVAVVCQQAWSQACFHYSSAIRVNTQWATLTCPPEAASTAHRLNAKATNTWSWQHNGAGWTDRANRVYSQCDRDEYPPAYLLGANDPAFIFAGMNRQGQLVRYVPGRQNQDAGKMWKGACFHGPIKDLSDGDFRGKVAAAQNPRIARPKNGLVQTYAQVTVNARPEFTISAWGHSANPPANGGLNDNPCWPSGIASADPGFALLTYDPYYQGKPPVYDYRAPYTRGSNGS
jgi:hypothetical protein